MLSTHPETRRWQVISAILLIALIGVIIWSIVSSTRQHRLYEHNLGLKTELDGLMLKHKSVQEENAQFSAEMAGRDSLIQAQSTEINKLIASQADYRKIQKKLTLLRKITQDYVQRIDSLIVVNHELSEENTVIKQEIAQEKERNKTLSRNNTELNSQMQEAAIFKAYNLRVEALRKRGNGEQSTDRADRAEKISVRFTLSENKLIQAGEKTVYVRIARPDGVVICEGEGDQYSFSGPSGPLQFSLKTTIDYQNAAQDVRLSWIKRDPKAEAMSGTYLVAVYMDGREIGRSSFSLR